MSLCRDRRLNSGIPFACLVMASSLAFQAWAAPNPQAPSIASLLKPRHYNDILQKREVLAVAAFKDPPPPGERVAKEQRYYQFYAAMLVRADFDLSRRMLADPAIYKRVVPFVSQADFDARTGILKIAGGVLGYRLKSHLRFRQRSPGWVSFQVVAGHFLGLKGNLYFEDRGEKGTLVYFGGRHISRQFPPAFVMTRGGEIALSISGRKMRGYVEGQSRKTGSQRKQDDSQIPQPRSYLGRPKR